ncbi:hypothetical protein [Denitromonas halophila]|uniref:HEAT repeat domain-containing protein n=1 Tax=Denitromonas halophila TaxID=1629404 RepID=A0A557R1K4_9RHOO|nr:hypothetical protein [Denitromonas halophila]TVO59043.1 hypothetical protein FHP91_05170 [Denitromonas halophila]
MQNIISVVVIILLAGCASFSPSLPENYSGDTATIDDSFQRLSRSTAKFYYIRQLNDKNIQNALTATYEATEGRGAQLIAMGASRLVPAEPLSLYVVGRVYHSAPIGYLINSKSNYIVEGRVSFTPTAGERYLVSGELGEYYSAVWIEDINGNVVSTMVEAKAPGYFKIGDSERSEKRVLTREELFFGLSGGESVGLVEEKLGAPNSVEKYRASVFSNSPSTVTYKYAGLGSVLFLSRNSEPEFVERVAPALNYLQQGSPIEAQFDSEVEAQLNSEGSILRHVARNFYRRDEIDVETLDLVAKKIWSAKSTEDRNTIDAIAWFCRVLEKSSNSRYRDLLEMVSVQAESSKVRKYARSAFELLPDVDVVQFVPDAD